VVAAAAVGGCAALPQTGAQPREKGHEDNVVKRYFGVDYVGRS